MMLAWYNRVMIPLSFIIALAPSEPAEVVDAQLAQAAKSFPGALGQMVGEWKLQEKLGVDEFMVRLPEISRDAFLGHPGGAGARDGLAGCEMEEQGAASAGVARPPTKVLTV